MTSESSRTPDPLSELRDSRGRPAAAMNEQPSMSEDAPSQAELRQTVKRALRESRYVDPELRRAFARMADQVIVRAPRRSIDGDMSDSQKDGVKPFRFLDLPPEPRTRIYEFLMLTREPRMIPSMCARDYLEGTKSHEICLVNRQTRQEALPVFYGRNTFEAHIHRNDFSFLTSWLDLIGDSNRKLLRTVHLVLQDRWLCADGLIDLVRALTRMSGTENIAFIIDTEDWVQKYSLTIDSESDDDALARKPIRRAFKMLERALVLVQRLREGGQVSETNLRYQFQKWLDAKGYKCKGHPASNIVHGKASGFGFDGFCSLTGRESSPSNCIPCGRGPSSLFVEMKREAGCTDVDGNNIDGAL